MEWKKGEESEERGLTHPSIAQRGTAKQQVRASSSGHRTQPIRRWRAERRSESSLKSKRDKSKSSPEAKRDESESSPKRDKSKSSLRLKKDKSESSLKSKRDKSESSPESKRDKSKSSLRPVTNSLFSLSFPKSRCALWDGTPTGDKTLLHLCANRSPCVRLTEKALRLAHRHVRHGSKPPLRCFFLGSVCVDADEEGVTVTLDRFDPGRDQNGVRVPSAALPGDVCASCVFTSDPGAPVQSEAELQQAFKTLHQSISGRQSLDLAQTLRLGLHVVWTQALDSADFSLTWSCVSPASSVHVEPVRAVHVIPTALLRSLTSPARPAAHSRQKGFMTMDQSRKLLLLLESDPKALSLPLVGLWFSGATHVHSPQVWAWILRFLYSASIQDR
ncbi:hypothetical protein WMY93_024299 [Mugilogobius chulae]|uniref:STIL N-terminal domain-containing protein n=1 Tax=Mugilogobius chulae TaxID=88201 RepID=A0AAW0N4U8_9GOBI